MMDVDTSHYRIVSESLTGEREVDERTFSSLAALAERLERLRDSDRSFRDVRFSPDVEELQRRKSAVAVG